jgi:hypothetical protein
MSGRLQERRETDERAEKLEEGQMFHGKMLLFFEADSARTSDLDEAGLTLTIDF